MNSGVVFSQIGSRDHYSYAKALYLRGRLDALVTDIWVPNCAVGVVRSSPFGSLRKLASRHNREIPDAKVATLGGAGYLHYFLEKADPKFHKAKCDALDRLTERILMHTRATSILGYMASMRGAIRLAASKGLRSGVIAYDGCQAADAIYARECSLHPDWAAGIVKRSDSFYDAVNEEFACADYVIVNSRWSRLLLERSGVPAEKIRLVSLSYSSVVGPVGGRTGKGPFNVLWVGNVSLGKGFYYFAEAVKKCFANRPDCVFHVVGSININRAKLSTLPGNVFVHGPVPRFEVANFYKNADLMVFPTLSDGFGLVQLEAMSYGVPVLASRFCADVVEHMVSGFVLDDVSWPLISQWLDFALGNRQLLREMREACVKRAGAFSEGIFSDALLGVIC